MRKLYKKEGTRWFMCLYDKISEQYEVTVDFSTQKILTKLLDQQQKQSWVEFFLSEKNWL